MKKNHILPYSLFVKVWLVLILLTFITVWGSLQFPGHIGIVIASIVTPIKGTLVLMFFMHLKYENALLKYMFLFSLVILAVFIGLTVLDTLFS